MRTKREMLLLKTFLIISFFSSGLFLRGPMLSAQENENTPENQQIEEIHDTKKLNKLLKDYNKNQKKVEQDAEIIKEMQASGEITDQDLEKADMEELVPKNSDKEGQGVLNAVMAKAKAKKTPPKQLKYSEAVKVTLAPLQKLSEAELVKLLKDNTQGSKAGPYIEKFPKLMLFAVRMIKDPQAIPSLVKVTEDQDKLIRFAGLMIATILFGILLKRFLHRDGRSIPKALVFWFFRWLFITGLRLALIFYFFGQEISPMLRVAHSVLFS